MAIENVQLNAGSGGNRIAVDRDTSASPNVDYQMIKPAFGADGTFTLVTSSVGLPVNIVQNTLNSSTVATSDSPNVYVTSVGLWTGSAYVRTPGDATNGVTVNLGSNNDVTVTGTVTANAGTNLNTSSLALESGGNLATIAGDTTSIDGKITACNTGAVVISSGSVTADTELAAAAALSDNYSNPTTAPVGAFGMVWDGSTWDRAPGTSADGTLVNLGSNNDIVLNAAASGGATPYKNIDVDESEDQVKATAGQIYWVHAINMTASVLYLHFYNATAASVTVGTTTPTLTFPVPTLATTNGAGYVLPMPRGTAFDTAITIACTTDVTGTGSPIAGPAANGCIVNMGYL